MLSLKRLWGISAGMVCLALVFLAVIKLGKPLPADSPSPTEEEEVVESLPPPPSETSEVDEEERLNKIAKEQNLNEFKYLVGDEIDEISKTDQDYILMFSSKHCGACKQMIPLVFNYMNLEDTDVADIYIVDVDNAENEKYANKYDIEATPTFIRIKEGEEIKRARGTMSLEELLKYGGKKADKPNLEETEDLSESTEDEEK